MKIVTEFPDEVVKIKITAYTRIPGKGRGGHLSSGETKWISLTETNLEEVYEVVESAIIAKCMEGG